MVLGCSLRALRDEAGQLRWGISYELAAGIAPVPRFGRMCAIPGVALIVAKSPEAKGRVERVHGTNQDRLVKKLRRAGIGTYADANQYLAATYWAAHSARFAVAPLEPADFHLPLAPRLDLAQVFCLETPRVIGNDWVVRYDNRALQIMPTARDKRHAHPRGRVVVRETRTGELFVVARTPEGTDQILEWQAVAAATHQPTYHDPARLAPAPRPAPVPVPPAPASQASGQPLSARQVAARARWSDTIAIHIARKAARAVPSTPGTGKPDAPPAPHLNGDISTEQRTGTVLLKVDKTLIPLAKSPPDAVSSTPNAFCRPQSVHGEAGPPVYSASASCRIPDRSRHPRGGHRAGG